MSKHTKNEGKNTPSVAAANDAPSSAARSSGSRQAASSRPHRSDRPHLVPTTRDDDANATANYLMPTSTTHARMTDATHNSSVQAVVDNGGLQESISSGFRAASFEADVSEASSLENLAVMDAYRRSLFSEFQQRHMVSEEYAYPRTLFIATEGQAQTEAEVVDAAEARAEYHAWQMQAFDLWYGHPSDPGYDSQD